MGFLAAIRSARQTFWLGLALFGYYFLMSDLVRRVLHADPNLVWFLFLALLVLYGFWTRAPVLAWLLTLAIVTLWVVGGTARSGLSPDIDPARPAWTAYHALAPVVAVSLGIGLRALRRRRRAASTATA